MFQHLLRKCNLTENINRDLSGFVPSPKYSNMAERMRLTACPDSICGLSYILLLEPIYGHSGGHGAPQQTAFLKPDIMTHSMPP